MRDHLLGDIVAITALPSVWVGQPPSVIADSLADSLDRILPLEGITVVLRTELGETSARRGAAPPDPDLAPTAAAADPTLTRVDVGPLGVRGALLLRGAPLGDERRLVARLAANLADSALRESTLARETADARSRAIKLEKHLALGQLVMGVAHELRTPVTYANNNLHLAMSRLDRPGVSPEARADLLGFLREVVEAHERIAHTVDALRRFSDPRQGGTRHLLPLSETVAEAARLFDVTHVGSVRLVQDLRSKASVKGDRVELQQVVLNLLQNAADATAGKGGTITLSTRDEGKHAILVVEDDGPGIPADLRVRLFTPFFTTKPAGTGLGLSIVRRIVESHQGTIALADGQKGARFEIALPAAG